MGPKKMISQSKARRGRSMGAREASTSSPSPRGPSPAASPKPPTPPPASPASSESEQPEATHKADVPTKRRREKPVYLTDDQQQLLADWLKDHPEIYTKGSRDFENTERKKRRWEDIAIRLAMRSSLGGTSLPGLGLGNSSTQSQGRRLTCARRTGTGTWWPPFDSSWITSSVSQPDWLIV